MPWLVIYSVFIKQPEVTELHNPLNFVMVKMVNYQFKKFGKWSGLQLMENLFSVNYIPHLSLYNQAKNFCDIQYVSGPASPSDHTMSGLYLFTIS